MELETDLLERVESFLSENTDIANVAIIDDIDEIPTEAGYPALGIFDGGDQPGRGASECIHSHLVFVVIYAEVLGSHRETVLEVREIWKTLKMLIPQSENFENGGVFEGFSHCRYVKSSKILKITKKDKKDSFIAMKIPLFDFTELVVEV